MPKGIDTDTILETFNLKGQDFEKVIEKIKAIVHEGNVRRIVVKNAQGQTLVVVPLSVGLIGAALLPVWAAIGAIAALVADCTIEVERSADA
jgi:hypothetical protein